jgi:hypothetical protein
VYCGVFTDPATQIETMASKKGPKFSLSEDYTLCKAFVVASEDGTVGTDQKGNEFKLKMFEIYCQLLKEHNEEFMTQYTFCASHSNYQRFKVISRLVLKYIGVEEASGDPPSGDTNRIEWLKEIKETFLKRHPDAKNKLENVLSASNSFKTVRNGVLLKKAMKSKLTQRRPRRLGRWVLKSRSN